MRRFTHSVVILISMSIVPTVRAAEWRISPLRIVPVSSRDDLRRLCRFAADLYACTAFESRSLAATCVASDARQWEVIAIAHVQPLVYLWDARFLGHERLHISDMETSIRGYVEQLARHRYDVENDCQRAAAAETAGFARQIDIFATASNELRHYAYAARNRAAK